MDRHVVVRNITRASRGTIAGLAQAGVATVHEAQGRKGLMEPAVRPIQSGARIAGSAVTALNAPGDNIMIHAAVEVIRPGDVLVVALTEPGAHGMFGDLLATSLRAHGCVGLVTDSGIRDSAELIEMGFPVWARYVFSEGTEKATPGSVNIPVVCAGATINPGDVVVADDDGVCVVPREEADSALVAANTRVSKEDAVRARLESGELGIDIYGLRDKLVDLGVEWADPPNEG